MQKIERSSFAGEDTPGRALDGTPGLLVDDIIAIVAEPVDTDVRVKLVKNFLDPGNATDHSGLTTDQRRPSSVVGGHQRGRQISRADIFSQGLAHLLGDQVSRRKFLHDQISLNTKC